MLTGTVHDGETCCERDLGASLEQLGLLKPQQTRDRMERVGRNRGMDAELRPVADKNDMYHDLSCS